MHSIIFLTFFLYGFYRVIFWKSPYPEDYFKDGMNESDVQLIEVEISRNDNILISDNDINLNKSFVDKLPGYKVKLEEWKHHQHCRTFRIQFNFGIWKSISSIYELQSHAVARETVARKKINGIATILSKYKDFKNFVC